MTEYFVANSGDDSNNGQSEENAWKTLAKVNGSSFNPGDNILFKRGDTFMGRLRPTINGELGEHIVFGAYGSGNKPIINGVGQSDSLLVSGGLHMTFQDLNLQLADGIGAGYGIRLTNACDDIYLARLDVVNTLREGIFINQSSNVVAEDCTATGCFVGLQFWGASHHCRVVGGSYYLNDEEGLDIEDGSHDIEVIGTTCHSNTKSGFDVDHAARDCVYRRCPAYSNGDNGFSICNDGDGFRYENCPSHSNGGNGWELQPGTGNNVVIVHCTSANNGSRNYRLDGGANHVFKNNIGKQAGWGSQLRMSAIVASTITIDYNCYYQASSAKNMIDTSEYSTLEDWQVATGQEIHSLFADPIFVDEFTDLHLQLTSPCVDAGVDIGQSFEGLAPDIGAYEVAKMPGKNVNIWITNWTNTGLTTPVPRWTADIAIEWTKGDGTPGTHSGTYTFPNVLAGVPLSRIRQYMEEIILREVRIQLGIDEEK